MNFYGSVPGSANFRKGWNSNQPSAFSANLSVYAPLHEKIYFGAHYSRLRNIKMGTIIKAQRCLFQWDELLMRGNICLIACGSYWLLPEAFWSTTLTVFALRKSPPIKKLVQEQVTYLLYMSVSTWLSHFHQSGRSGSKQISIKCIQKWVLIEHFSKTKARCGWVLVSFYLVWWAVSFFRVMYLRAADRAKLAVPLLVMVIPTCFHTWERRDQLPKYSFISQ